MEAVRRFNQTSAVICLLVARVPMAYAQGIEPGATMGAAVTRSTFARVYQHGQSGMQDLTKTLAWHQRRRLKEMSKRNTNWPRCMRTATAVCLAGLAPLLDCVPEELAVSKGSQRSRTMK